MDRHKVTIACFTPSYVSLFAGACPPSLRCLLIQGERPHTKVAKRYAGLLNLYNSYRATENTDSMCIAKVQDITEHAVTIPAGRPFPHVGVHILKEDGSDAGPGETGIIHVT
eukprot:ANDGO_03144.mRNA.1 hypothetical protein